MPQMSPMLWLFLYLYFLLMLMMIMIMIYYLNLYLMNNYKMIKPSYMSYKMKW